MLTKGVKIVSANKINVWLSSYSIFSREFATDATIVSLTGLQIKGSCHVLQINSQHKIKICNLISIFISFILSVKMWMNFFRIFLETMETVYLIFNKIRHFNVKQAQPNILDASQKIGYPILDVTETEKLHPPFLNKNLG